MILEILSDTGFVLSMRWMIAAVFLLGVVHKLGSPAAFVTIVDTYRLLPRSLTAAVAYTVLAAELIAAASLLLNAQFGSMIALALIVLYTVAISINLARGRRDIDCGCAGPAVRQTLSGWLVVRNIGLIAVLLLTLLPESSRGLILLDWFTAFVAAVTFGLIYLAATEILAVRGRFVH